MHPVPNRRLGALLLGAFFCLGCQDKYGRLPAATNYELQALTERYQALIDEAKKSKDGDQLKLLHHFSHAALSLTSKATFTAKAEKFIAVAASGKLNNLTIQGARAPSKVRLLLVKSSAGSGAIPFVQSSDGWKLDDVELALGDFTKEINLKGNMPASPPSALPAISVLQDPRASDTERVQAAIELAGSGDKDIAGRFSAGEEKPWPKTALLYASWKTGGPCEPFAKAFPIEGKLQNELYDADTESYRTLLQGLTECAASSKKLSATLKVYQGCSLVEGGARSEYVDPVAALANAKPEYLLGVALQTNYNYEVDPVANIVVGVFHGEKDKPFYQFIQKKAKEKGKAAKLAGFWVKKMAEKDKIEPTGEPEGEK